VALEMWWNKVKGGNERNVLCTSAGLQTLLIWDARPSIKAVAEQMHLISVKAQPELVIPERAGVCCTIEWLEVASIASDTVGKRTYSALRQAREVLAEDWKGQGNDGGNDIDELHFR